MSKPLMIAALNLKGGCAKTTTTVNLGGVLHESGRKPLLIDIDPQKSATFWAGQGNGDFPFPVVPIEVNNARQFKTQLDKLIKDNKADTVLFDCPPALAHASLLAALLADIVLIPVTPSPLDVIATQDAIKTILDARKERKGKYPQAVLIPSRLIQGTVLAREIKGSLKQFNELIAPSISMRVALSEACIAGQTINNYAPNSTSHKEFKSLMKFLLTNIKK